MLISQQGFRVVRPKGSDVEQTWAQLDAVSASILYNGQITRRAYGASDDGELAFGSASGIGDTSHKYIPHGVVVGNNQYTWNELFSTTYNTPYISYGSAVTPTQAILAASSRVLAEGPTGKGDKAAMVKLAVIKPGTVLRGRIFNGSWGTAPTLLTATSAMTDGLLTANMTTNTCEFTPVAGTCTIYCRTGANAGIYRTTKDTSTTAPQVLTPFPKNAAIGDTFVRCGLPMSGLGLVQFDALSMFVDNATSGGTTNYYFIDVLKLDLSDAGNEYVEFSFATIHFDPTRA